MKSIRFSEDELEFLRNHYEFELAEAENYVEDIKSILKKLGSIKKEVIADKPAKAKGKKRGRPKAVKSAEVAPEVVKQEVKKAVTARKKPGPKKKKMATKKKSTAQIKAEAPVQEAK